MMRWEEIFNFFENKEWLKSIRASQSKMNILEAIRKIEFHWVVVGTKICPYYGMISWILAHDFRPVFDKEKLLDAEGTNYRN